MPDNPCPACGAPLLPWLVGPAADHGDPRTFTLDRCEICGLGVMRDPPAEAVGLHESGSYAPGTPRLHRAAGPILKLFDGRRLRLLRRRLPEGGRVLEVGSGRGRFLTRLRDRGYDARGLEPSGHRQEESAALGLDVEQATVEAAEVEPESEDAVVAWHVLEHLPDPGMALDRFRTWLRPGGTLLLGVPNRRSLQARVSGGQWFHLDLPRHRFHFSPESLALLLEQHGFRVERVVHLLAEHNLFGMWQTLMNGLTFNDNFLYGVLKRTLTPATAGSRARFWIDALVTAMAGIPAFLVAVPLELAAGLARRGGTIAVVATRAS